MTTHLTNLNTPWSLQFDRDGTEDVAIICDAAGDVLVRSRHFWLPKGGDPVPATLAAMRVMMAGPNLLTALIAASDWINAQIGTSRTEIQAQVQQAIADASDEVSPNLQ
jgi:hypothetical protein